MVAPEISVALFSQSSQICLRPVLVFWLIISNTDNTELYKWHFPDISSL